MSPLSLLWLLAALVTCGSGSREADGLCGAPCTATSDPRGQRYPRGMRYTYRYSTVSTSSPPHAPSESSGLALDCLLDVDVLPGCQLMMKLRNSQIKRVSPQKENSVQRIKNLREALERNPLMFSLRDGKVAQVCPREGDPVWALNIKRAIVSMLQTSHAGDPQETVKETDVYGTCVSHYERRGSLLVKTRDLRGCLHDRLAGFWLRSVPLSQDNAVESSVQCVQRHGDSAIEEVNCTETVRLAPLAGRPVGARVHSVSTLTLLRTQDAAPVSQDLQVYSGDLRFEDETGGPARARQPDPPESADTVKRLCAIKSDQQQADLFLHLVFQLRVLSHWQLQQLWQEASFKCRDDWQPLLDALPACGSEACVSLMTELLQSGELEPERVSSFLSAFAFVARPSAAMVASTTALLQSPETRTGALLAVSSIVHTLCLRMTSPCSLLPQVQQLLQVLKEMLEELCGEGDGSQLTEKLHVLKAVGNAGLAAAALIPELEECAQSQSTPLELRLAAIQAFRRIPCTADRRALLQLYSSPREDVEVRVTAYQQIMRCPDRDVLRRVRATLKNESSSQVGSYVWSHLTQIQKTDDPLKQTLMEMLPDDIISKDFEGETWKYSSYMDTTMDTGFGSANMEGALVFTPSSFVPRSAMVNLTAHVLGRAFNLLEIDLRVENADPLLRKLFGHHETAPSHDDSDPQAPVDPIMREKRSSEGTVEFSDDGPPGQGEKGGCQARSSHLRQAGAMFTGHQSVDHGLRCGIGVKVFGNELAFMTCDDVATQGRQLSLSLAGMAVRLLKGQEVQFHRRAVLATEELILPSLSGWPVKVAVNMSTSLSIRIKGSAILKSWSHFSVSGYVKPSAYVGVSARMGLESPCGQAGVEWLMGLRSSTSLDGGVQLQRGQDLKASLNTPEDSLDIVHFSSRMYSVSGENREELRVSRDHTDRTTCSPQDWSRVLGWQLCSQVSYPSSPGAVSLPPSGAVLLSLRLQKLDRGLQQYLLEAAYSLIPQKGSWLPMEASLHLFLGTPQSSIPRDLSMDFTFSSPKQRLLLKIRHPLKSIQVQGQIDQAKNTHNAKLELWVDGVHHYYIKGLTDVQTLPTEQKLLTHLEAKLTAGGRPIILSANLTRGLGRKISLSAMMRNVFKETASLSVLLERRLELAHRQYSVDVDLLLPGLLGTRVFGLMQNRASQWSSALRVKYGLRGDARNLRHECHMSQTARNEMQPNETHHLRAEHELHCSHTMSINHKLLLRHEEGPGHVRSVLDLSYGKHWDEINNKRRVLLSQSFKNQSRHALTSYLLEFSLQVLEKHLSYRTQLLHSHLRQKGAESSTHLKVNYNDQLPLVAGLHWRDLSKARLHRWEGAFNMDTPWLYVYTAHKLSQPQRRAVQFSTEVTTRKWVTLRSLVLEGFYREKSRECEGRLHLYTPTDTYFKVSGWGTTGKQSLKASGALSSAWTPTLRGDLSLEGKKDKKALQLVSSYGRQNISISASVITVDKRLRKRLVAMKVVLMEPKGLPVELELEGAVEELKRDRELYQKQGTLRLRQPFLHFPQKLLLHEVFTVDLRRSRYILESRAVLSGNKECLHRLTLSYHPGKPFVCSALTHPFRSETVPQDSELCVTLHTNQSQQEVQGTVRVSKKDRLIVLGHVQNISDPSQQGWVFQVNLTHLLQIQVPQSLSLQGALYWKPSNDSMFGYLATGKAVVDHQRDSQFAVQLNGSSREVGLYSSFSQHHSSAVPKTFQAHARAEREGGRIGTSVYVKTDGEEQANLEADLVNVAEEDTRLLGARAVLRQKLVPVLQDLDVQLSTNVSADRMSAECSVKQAGGSLQAQLGGALEHRPGLRASIRGGLQHSLASLPALPPTLGLEGALRQSQQLTEGQLSVVVGEAAYGLELHHQGAEGPGEHGMLGVESGRARAWLHMSGPGQNLHVNVSSNLGGSHGGGLHATLSHSSTQLLAAGLPLNSSMQASWTYRERGVFMVTELQLGSQGLQAEIEGGQRGQGPPRWELFSSLRHHCTALLQRGVPRATDVSGHYQAEPNAVSAAVAVQVDQRRKVEVLVEGGQTNGSVRVAVSMEHDVKRLLGVLPARLQMDCSGDAGAEQLSGRCSGAVADQPVEVRAFRRWGFRPHCLGLQLRVGRQAAQAEGCYGTLGRAELTASAVHSSGALHSLGLPRQAHLRALLEPGAGSWRCVLRASTGRMKAHLSGELRVVPLCRWRSLASYRGPGSPSTVEVRGLVTVRRCHLEADFSTVWDRGTSSLAVLAHCGGLRIKGTQVQEGPRGSRTSFVAVGRMGQNRVMASLGLKQNRDTLSCQGSLVLLERRVELCWTLRHRWASLRRTVPERLSMDGWGRMGHSSVSGGVRLALGSRTAQLDVSTAWRLNASLHAALRHGLPPFKAAGIPEDSRLSLAVGSGRVRADLVGARCAVSAQGALQGMHRKTWSLTVQQRCAGLQMRFPRQFSVNGTVATAACGLHLDTQVESGAGEGAGLSLVFDCAPKLRLQATAQHTFPPLRQLGIPAHNTLTVSAQKDPASAAVLLDLTLGQCELRVQAHMDRALGPEDTGSSWAANLTNRCLVLKDAGVPESLELSGLLSLSPCRSDLSCSLTADSEALALQLSHSCRPTHSLTGALSHSFSRLGSWGLPSESRLVLTAPGGPGRDGTLLLKAGSCRVRASGDMKPGGRSQWVWTTETECPLLEGFSLPAQSRFNGSLLLEDCELEVRANARVGGQWASVRLTAGCRQGLRLEGLPEPGSLMPGSRRAPPLWYGAELELRVRRCTLGVSGGLWTAGRLEGSLLLHNNCTALQHLGAPSRVEGHGSLLMNTGLMDSRVSLVSGDTHLRALLSTKAAWNRQEVLAELTHSATLLREVGLPTSTTLSFSSAQGQDSYHRAMSCSLDSQQISEDLSVERTGTEVRVEYRLDHSVGSLRGWGMPENNSIQAELDFGQARRLSVRSQLGDRFVSLGAHLKDTLVCTEVTGTLEHSWAWLQEKGLPSMVEVLCSIQGSLPQLQARAHLSTDGEKLLASALNVSLAGGRLALLLSLAGPPHLVPGPLRSLDAAITAHYRGSQKHASMDLYCNGTRVQVVGEATVWGASGREARVALQHSTEREDTPTIQVEAWGRLTETQLRGSLAWNPKTNSSLAITVQGHNLPARKELNCKVHQSIPTLQLYLPPQLDAKTQVNHTSSTLHGFAEVKLGGNELRAMGELSITESGYKQAVEVKHSLPQLKSLPRNIALNLTYEGGNRTCRLQQRVVWGGQELSVSGQYLSPEQERGTHRLQVQMTGTFAILPSACGLDVQLERSAHRLLDRILLDWKGQGTTEKVRVLCSRTSDDELWEGRVELRQPFTPPLSHLHLHALSHSRAGGQGSSHQAWLSWNDGKPMNVTLTVSRQWQGSSTRGQACLSVSPGQVRAVLPLVELDGCGSVAREGNSYSQTAELKWGGKRITQAMKYQRGARGGHTLQLEGGADNVSPQPCPSHTLLAQVHTNGRDQLEHHLLLGLCPPHPSWAVSGYHRVGAGQELLYSQTRLSVSGQSQYSGLTVVLTNTSTPPRTNFSLHTELKVGDGALELGGSVFSSRRGGGLQVQAALDRSERLWLQGVLEGRCVQAAAGYNDGVLSDDNLTVMLCLEGRRRVTLEAQRTEGGVKTESLASISLRAANQSLTFTAQGCMESLQAAEARVCVLGSRVRNKLLDKIRVLQRLLLEIRRQSQDSVLLREMSERPLRWAQKAEALLVQRVAGAWATWRKGVLRYSLTDRVPRCLESLRRLSLQLQQELKRPLATLAGAYQDATGRRLDAAWKDAVALWSRKLAELLPAVLEEHQLGAPLRAALGTLTAALDLVSQQTAQWVESRLGAALVGIRRRLASLYKLSHGRCEVSVQLPLPRGAWSDVGGAGMVEFLLEEWLLRPVVTVASLRPSAELYRLKRRMMESPFNHQALLVSDQFALSFDGRLYELPGRCPLLLARDLMGGSFTVVLSPNTVPERTLLVEMSNTTVSVSLHGQVEKNCQETDQSFSDSSVLVRRDGVLVQMSNQNGALLSCDLSQEVCSLTLDGWQHGVSLGLLGTNDNEAGNELTLPNGSQADGEDHFLQSWQLRPHCHRGPCSNTSKAEMTSDLPSCASLFSDLDSPLSSCFRVVDPGQFLAVCERSRCHRGSAPCRLAAAFVHLCRRNYVPLELPELCVSV